MTCQHDYVDSWCAKCGHSCDPDDPTRDDTNEITQQQKLELAKLRDAFDDAVALLRDWEDYDPDDPECGWQKRRDEFLAEHEGAGR